MEASGIHSSAWNFALVWSPAFRRLLFEVRALSSLLTYLEAALRRDSKRMNDIQTALRELPLDKLEKLGEMLAELKRPE